MKNKIISSFMPIIGLLVMFITYLIYHQFDIAVSLGRSVSHLMMSSAKLGSGICIALPLFIFNYTLKKEDISFQRIVLLMYLILFIILFYMGNIGIPFRSVVFYSFVITVPISFGIWIGFMLLMLIRTLVEK